MKVARALILPAMAAALSHAAIRTGPDIGSKMPDFEATDQDGQTRRLSGLFGPKGAVLVVFRSADW